MKLLPNPITYILNYLYLLNFYYLNAFFLVLIPPSLCVVQRGAPPDFTDPASPASEQNSERGGCDERS